MRVVASVSPDGLERRRRYELVPVTRVKARDVDPAVLEEGGVDGHRPAGQRYRLHAEAGKADAPASAGLDAKGLDVGGTIFGTDNRYLFDDQSFPWRTTGKVNTVGKWGSGTTIGPRHVLTASHVVNWTGGSGGGVAWLTFTPATTMGAGPGARLPRRRSSTGLQAPGTLSDQQTAFDYVVLVMEERIGDIVGYPGYRRYSDDWNDGSYWQYIGYPGELSSGERLAFQGTASSRASETKASAARRASSSVTSTSSRQASRAAPCGAGGEVSGGHAWSVSEARSAARPFSSRRARRRATTSTAAARAEHPHRLGAHELLDGFQTVSHAFAAEPVAMSAALADHAPSRPWIQPVVVTGETSKNE